MTTVILTGGGSRRMGSDKAMLPWQGKTMLQSLIDRYSVLGDVAVSVNRPGRFKFHGATELVDEYPDMGPINGVVSAFRKTDAQTVFMTATDLPFGQPELAERLASLLGDCDACILRRGMKSAEPLFAVYSRSCLDPAEKMLRAGRKRFMELLDELYVRYVADDELPGFELERILMNVNTREDYDRIACG